MICHTSVENAPFHKALSNALEEVLKAQAGQRMRSPECYQALIQDERYLLPDGRPRYTEGQVRSALFWMANNRPGIKMVLRDKKVREYWVEAQED